MIRLGQLPANNPHWTEVPYMDKAGYCTPCQVKHRAASAVGRDHATAAYWTSQTAVTPIDHTLRGIFGVTGFKI